MMTSEVEPGVQSRPTRPFIPGREADRTLAQAVSSGFARPFRVGGVPGPSAGTAADGDLAGAERAEVGNEVAAAPVDEVVPEAVTADIREDQAGSEAGWGYEAESATTFAPLVSWDPLTDVGLRADQAAELDVEVGALAFPHTSVTEAEAVAATEDAAPPVDEDAIPPVDEVASRDVEFAAKLEVIADAIRAGKVEALLAEHPQDALTALVVGYYLGTAQRGGLSGR